MNTPELRCAKMEDAVDIARLEASIFPDAWGHEAILSYIDTTYVVIKDSRVVAYLISNLIAPEGELYRIAVSEECRKTGIGKALLSYATNDLKKRGLSAFYLEVREKNIPARTLYTSFGFKETGVRRNYYKNPSDNAVLMVYNL